MVNSPANDESGHKPQHGYEAVVQLLSRPDSYSEQSAKVEDIETHISHVFLTDQFVYKLKKPVRYDFLDFRTCELRRAACEAEVRLNRRLAPDVYLDVLPITTDDEGRLSLGGDGTPVDWVVKMRRLPNDRSLDQLIAAGAVTESQIHELAETLVQFYRQLSPQAVKADDYRRHIEQHVRANRHELLRPDHQFDALIVKRVHAAQLKLLHVASQLLDQRVADGRIVDGHGDLKPEHVYLLPEPTIIDCIEFNAEFRQLDELDELGFLAMECDYLGAESIGTQIIEAYCRKSGDESPAALLAFYKSYRACVRAKVLALRAVQLEEGKERQTLYLTARQYLRLAERYTSQLGPPLLMMVRGLSGVGKSSLATALAESLGMELLQTDVIRREMFAAAEPHAAFNEDLYRRENRDTVYQEMLRRTGALLAQGQSVVLDGTFLAAHWRADAVALARRHGHQSLVVRCHCDEAIAMQRIRSRMSAGPSLSDARPKILQQQREEEEPDSADIPSCDVDTTQSLSAMTDAVFASLAVIPLADKRGTSPW
jgi:aminoglycoside phosphotransferase family enzyme/predicted kinase